MKRLLFVLASGLTLLAFVSAAHAQSVTRFSGAQAQRDLRVLQRSLTALHPGLYHFISPGALDSAFALESAKVANGASRAELFLAAARLAAFVRCGHTVAGWYNQSDAMNREVVFRADKLPLHMELVERRFLVTASAAESVAAGDEILAIDGRPTPAIVGEMLAYTRADGASDGKRLQQLSQVNGRSAMDLYFPALHAPGPAGYRLTLRGPRDLSERTVTVPAISLDERDSLLAARGDASATSQAWTLRIERDTAWWTLPTFSFWRGEFDWRTEVQRVFALLAERRVRNLVIDIRRNEGGDGAVGDSLVTHLIRRPLVLPASRAEGCYERVPYVLARFLDTWDFDFFDRTGRVVPTGGRNVVLAGHDTTDIVMPPAAAPFAGRTFVLVGPENSSATFEMVQALKRSGAVTLVGQPTGGNQRGINGGELCWVTLPNSGAAVDVPLVAWVARTPMPDAGITPDVVVEHRFDDAAAGIDPDVRAVRTLIARGGRRSR